MKTFLVRVALFVFMGAPAEAAAQQAPAACEPQLPAGLVIRIFPDAPLKAGTVAGPVVFTVDSDIALFRNSPATIPRGAKVFGRVVNSRKAGRIPKGPFASQAFKYRPSEGFGLRPGSPPR